MSKSISKMTRRELLAGAGAAALLLEQRGVQAQPAPNRTVVFTHTTVVNADAVQDDVALAVVADTIAAIGATDAVLRSYPAAEIYDGRGKALLPGLINCHAHMAAVLERGFNEDFGFPNSARLAVRPASLLQGREHPDDDGRGAGSDPHAAGDRRELRGHCQIRGGAGAERAALRLRRVDPRQRECRGADVAGRAGAQ
jgi:hypothetical protein